jgi:NitT/TauT family transport system substrate-binding protein
VGPVAFSSLCASRQWLQTDMARAFMRAYRKAQQFVVEAGAEEIAAVEADLLPGIDRDVLITTIKTYQQLGCWTQEAEISHQSYDNLLDVFLYNGKITSRYPYVDCIVNMP